ncbi:hypothetical protein L873DRAFT_1797826, partial [Choiromyces venosus 120613-1]
MLLPFLSSKYEWGFRMIQYGIVCLSIYRTCRAELPARLLAGLVTVVVIVVFFLGVLMRMS